MHTIFALAAGLFLAAAPLSAHHGIPSVFDTAHPIILKGNVTKFSFTNPHCQILFDVKDSRGSVAHWIGEMKSPHRFIQAGWNKKRAEEALKPGTAVTVIIYPGKAGNPVGLVQKILNTKGEPVLAGIDPQ